MPAVANMPRRRRHVIAWCALVALLLAVAAAALVWVTRGSFVERVEAEVRAGLPLGTSREEAEAWARRTYGFVPQFDSDVTGHRFVGRSVPELAGMNGEELGGLVRTVARRRGPIGEAMDLVDHDHVWVYILLDKQERVSGYFFLSLGQLRDMEQAKLRH
jgi:hypothetical protein